MINFAKNIYHILIKLISKFVSFEYSFRNRLLTNRDFTIISNNCIAGFIYHDLNMSFLSPTINLTINNHDYIKFLLNIEHYLSLQLVEVKSNDKRYPVGLLGDIGINFIHYNSFEEAKMAWERRKTRINFKNIYVIFYPIDENIVLPTKTLDYFIKRYKNLIIFDSTKKTKPYFKFVKKGKYWYQKNIFGQRYLFSKWNYINFLNK